jgi:hypothetical protein
MVSRTTLIGAAAGLAVVIVLLGAVWALGIFPRSGAPQPQTPTSPVTVVLSCSHTPGTFLAVVTSVSEEEPFGDYQVSLVEVPTDSKIVTKATVRKAYIGGNGDVSLFYNDNDDDARLSVRDDFWVGSFGTGPYDVTVFWAENGATVTTVRCSS